LAGREAYWRNFGIFFEDRFRGELGAAFLHGLFEVPRVTIEEIITRVNFHRDCESIFLIDDENNDDIADNEDVEDSKDDIDSMDRKHDSKDGAIRKKLRLTPTPPSNPPSNPPSLNLSARTAITRILTTSFTTPSHLASLLSFSTGCPQLPPAGLDALRLSIHCIPGTTATGKFSKSHTCSNTIDFYASAGVKETREAFLESVLSSSGFGFD